MSLVKIFDLIIVIFLNKKLSSANYIKLIINILVYIITNYHFCLSAATIFLLGVTIWPIMIRMRTAILRLE